MAFILHLFLTLLLHVLNDYNTYDVMAELNRYVQQLLRNKSVIEVEDFGAGSAVIPVS